MVVKEYDSMSAEEKGPLDNMYNFFCGLHSLVHIAEASSKALVQAEMRLFDGDVPRPSSSFLQSRNSSEPGVCRLVRTAAKGCWWEVRLPRPLLEFHQASVEAVQDAQASSDSIQGKPLQYPVWERQLRVLFPRPDDLVSRRQQHECFTQGCAWGFEDDRICCRL